MQTGSSHDLTVVKDRSGVGGLRFEEVRLWGERMGELPVTGGNLNVWVRFGGRSIEPKPSRVSIDISTALGAPLIICSSDMTDPMPQMIRPGESRICCIPTLPLTAGSYLLTLFVEQDGVIQDWLPHACKFEVCDADFYGHGRNIPAGCEGQTVLVSH